MLEVAGMDAFYGDSHILHGLSLQLAEGARLAVVGRNGAGKSTLLKGIMNAGPRVTGSIRFAGQPMNPDVPANRRARLGLALVPEDRRIFGHLSTLENLRLAQRASPPGRDQVDVEALFSAFPMLQPLRDRPGGRMSGGQQQMLAVARGIAAHPRLLLLDEPTEGLAPAIVEELAERVVAACARYGIALLLAEQSIAFARHCTDRVLVLDTGRVAFAGGWDAFEASADAIRRHLVF